MKKTELLVLSMLNEIDAITSDPATTELIHNRLRETYKLDDNSTEMEEEIAEKRIEEDCKELHADLIKKFKITNGVSK